MTLTRFEWFLRRFSVNSLFLVLASIQLIFLRSRMVPPSVVHLIELLLMVSESTWYQMELRSNVLLVTVSASILQRI